MPDIIIVQLEGSLTQFSLRELIEMVLYSSVTGLLEIQVDNELTLLFFVDGQPISAHAHDLTGPDAVALMFTSQGNFHFYAGSMPEWKNLWLDPWELISRAEAIAPRWAAVRQEIPSTRLIPGFVELDSKEAISIPDHYWPLLAAMDGKRSVAQLSNIIGIELLETCEALAFLKKQGLITLIDAKLVAQTQSTAAQKQARPVEDGFFERLIARSLADQTQEQQLTAPAQDNDDQASYPSPGERYIVAETRYRELRQRYADVEH